MTDDPSYLAPHRLHVLYSSISIWKELSHHTQRFFYTFVSSEHGKLGPRILEHQLHTLPMPTFMRPWSTLYYYISIMSPPFQGTYNFLALICLELLEEVIQSHRLFFGLISSLVPPLQVLKLTTPWRFVPCSSQSACGPLSNLLSYLYFHNFFL